MLDWVEHPDFVRDLEALVAGVPCRIPPDAQYMPRGHREPTEARLDSFGRKVIPTSACWDELPRWWLRYPKGANTPNWDLAVECEVRGTRGLLLVEAKANVPELSSAGKAPERNADRRSAESRRRSAANLAQIRVAIGDARVGLERAFPGITIGADSHYQLSNRLAFAWKLASHAVPCVLVYLGFTGDTALREPLRDEAHWRSLFAGHVAAMCPQGIREEPVGLGPAPFWVLCRARAVLDISPSPEPRSRSDAWGHARGDAPTYSESSRS